MADRMGLGGTTLHYLAVQQAMVSVHRYLRKSHYLACLPGRLIAAHPREWLLNANADLSQVLLKLSLCLLLEKKTARPGSYC